MGAVPKSPYPLAPAPSTPEGVLPKVAVTRAFKRASGEVEFGEPVPMDCTTMATSEVLQEMSQIMTRVQHLMISRNMHMKPTDFNPEIHNEKVLLKAMSDQARAIAEALAVQAEGPQVP